LGYENYILVNVFHHIIIDGWSKGILFKELSEFYQAFLSNSTVDLPELTIQYADFAVWQRQWLQGEILENQLNYWKKQLTAAPLLLELPTDKPRPANPNFRGHSISFQINSELTEKLKLLSQKSGATLFMTLLAALNTLLFRYSGQDDILIGTPTANRNRQEIEPLIGFFVNTLVLRNSLEGNPAFSGLLQQARNVVLEAYANQDVPFEQVVDGLEIERSLSYNPLFQVMFALQNAPLNSLELPHLKAQYLAVKHQRIKFDLSLILEEIETEQGSYLEGFWEYDSHLFTDERITRMVGHFQTLLKGIVANPQQTVRELPLLTESEKQQLLVEWNQTQTSYPDHYCIHQLFEEQVVKTPHAIALIDGEKSLTYEQLNQKANQLAHYLQNLGITSESLVGVCVERSPEMLIAILSILKAGGAYVPLDPSYPQERLEFVLKDAKVSTVLISSHLLDKISKTKANIIVLDKSLRAKIAQQSFSNLTNNITNQNSIYVIYTSGSTGQPKGVINTHHGLHNRLLWMQNTYQLTPSDRILQKTPFSFDVSVWEFFWPLLNGACLVMAKPEGHKDSHYLVKSIIAQQITTLHFVPSMLQAFLEEKDLKKCKSIQRVFCSGEALSLELQNLFFKHFDAELHNLYGPTEAAIDVTAWKCIRDSKLSTVPIGYPIANTQIYILDTHLQPVPVGVPGELHIGGVGLARGYYNRPELTAEKFIPNPFNSQKTSDRLYKTGDLVRYLADGNIEYLGRLDYQVKIRGLRIELGEIETVLNQHPDIKACRVIAQNYHLNEQYIVAYIILQEPLSTLKKFNQKLQDFLSEKLPDYMIPSHFITLDQFPLTPSGKLDQQSLPKLENINQKTSVYVAPQNPIEEKIVIIWQEVLKLEKIGIYDNFFELGGHSLLATRVNSRLREAFQMDIPLRTLFEKPTVYSLAERISTMQMTLQQFSQSDSIQKGNRKEMEI
jgi:amino acid adenylation domain-containing protein